MGDHGTILVQVNGGPLELIASGTSASLYAALAENNDVIAVGEGGTLLVIAPQLFPRAPGQGFNVSQMLCAGACGAIGALIGFLIGRLIEGPSGK